jgi:hypothetical protein
MLRLQNSCLEGNLTHGAVIVEQLSNARDFCNYNMFFTFLGTISYQSAWKNWGYRSKQMKAKPLSLSLSLTRARTHTHNTSACVYSLFQKLENEPLKYGMACASGPWHFV